MSVQVAQKRQLFIPYSSSVKMLQYYVPSFNISTTAVYGRGAYGYFPYGSTAAAGSATPTWGSSTSSIDIVKINDEIFSSVSSLALCESTPNSFYYDSSAQILYINTDTIDTYLLYPDMKNSPTWYKTQTWVKESGEWKKASVWVKISGTWVKVS